MTSEFTPKDANFKAKVRTSFDDQAFMKHLGATLEKVEPGHCEIAATFRPELTQQNAYFHAGVIGTLADNAGGYAAFSLMPAEASILTVEFKLNLLRPAKGMRIFAVGKVIRPGKQLSVSQANVFIESADQEAKLCATALITLMQLER